MVSNHKKLNTSFTLFTIAIASVLLLPNLFRHGLFMDGLLYAAIANNLASGIGSFWEPKFSETIFPTFHEHPPLVFGLQSLFFKVFGDGFYIEKIYTLLTAIGTGIFIALIWKAIFKNSSIQKLFWLPLLLWITIPKVLWSYNSNMLENTMGLFSISSIYLLIKSKDKPLINQLGYFMVISILLFLSFLSKGFPGLFPLAFFFCYFLAFERLSSFMPMVKNTVLLLMIGLGISALYLLVNEEATESLSQYINTQVLTSIEGKQRVGSRINFLLGLLNGLIVILILTVGFIISFYKKNISKLLEEKNAIQTFLFFLCIGLTASLPLLVSPKLSDFYFVPAFPYFSLSFSALIAHIIDSYLNKINMNSFGFKLFKKFAVVGLILSIGYSVTLYGKSFRDKDLIADVRLIGNTIPSGSTLTVSKSLYGSWSSIAYFQRYFKISIDRTSKQHIYALVGKQEPITDGYNMVKLELSEFKLLKRKD